MKKLYKATYHCIIYASEDKALDLGECLADFRGSKLSFTDVSEVKDLDQDLPISWAGYHNAILSDEGDETNETIEELFDISKGKNSLLEEIKALKERLANLESQVKH